MPPPRRISQLLKATETLTLEQAHAFDESYWNSLMDDKVTTRLDRVEYVAYWFDFYVDWAPMLYEALDIAGEQEWTDEPAAEQAFVSAAHLIRLAMQAMVFEVYLKPEEFDSAVRPVIEILGE